ncbi:MAG TPA: RseA family anti-sigma factor, partial [Woeseiaceae bacterium]|nr:RseA family anti-sigma factor [Woeseiaceae bacterium]
MNDALRMQVSAFVDGELPENETELLLRRLSQDPALRQLVAEYLSLGRVIRREREIPGMGELRGRIARTLGEEPAIEIQPPSEPRRLHWLKPVGGLAIAASVAALAVVGLRSMEAPPGAPRETMQAAAPAAAYTQPRPEEAAARQQPSDMLMQYYLRHGETSADLGPNGILTRLVTLELRHGELQEVEPTRT